MKYAELFAGVGGFRVGIEKALTEPYEGEHYSKNSESRCGMDSGPIGEQAGYQCVYSNEWDKYAASIYRYHFGDIDESDIRTADPSRLPDFDLLTFGWPCQDNSIAGQRAGMQGERSSLLTEAVRILRAKMPKYFIAENVPGLFSVNEGYDFYEAIRLFTDAGYDVQWQRLNTRWFLPQSRERIFFVGHIRGTSRPEVFPIGETGQQFDERNPEIAVALQSPGHASGNYRGMNMVIQAGHRTRGKARVYDGEIPSITQDYGTGGQNVPMIANCLDVDGYLRTGARPRDENDKPQLLPIGYRRIRRLTPIECERLQGFPDDFTKYGKTKEGKVVEISDTQRYKVMGNAVSVPVVAAVVGRLLKIAGGER